jgi:integration host factor subunit beta
MSKNVSKSEIIETLANKFSLTEGASKSAVNAILDGMINALASGDRIEIRRFGSFEVRERKPRQARNPKTGENIKIDSLHLVHFKAGKPLRDKINAYFKPET